MKIAFYEIKGWEKDYIKKRLKGHKLYFFEEQLDEKNVKLSSGAEVISIFISSKIKKNLLQNLRNLKAIVTRSTGYDHINLSDCKKRKIKIYNVPNYGQNTVAEHTFALILCLSRKINKAYEKTIRGNFSPDNLEGFDLKGKTIGIIGMGNIGKHVAKIANGFEMKVIGHDAFPKKNLEKELKFKFVKLNELLKNSDIVTLHCPYNKKTHHLINSKNIKLMKKNAILINTSRGGMVETDALVKALSTKNLWGAGLDVLEEEGLINEETELLSFNFPKEKLENLLENHLLLTFENVVITPHIAFYSKEAMTRIIDTTLENIECIIKDKNCGAIVRY
ncbi:hydroxyacid dehydrogenase [Candidatus Pacearchaeota archaeon]|nr:hydroxyacid dehydrogenase [Candidatus Pacearchaeota archaeon]